MPETSRNLMLVGVGGQGVVLASNIVATALLEGGYDVKKSEVHGMAQRGGVVYSHLRFGSRVASPLLSKASAEVLLAFEWAESLRWLPYLRRGGTLIASVDRIVPPVACSDRRTWASGYPAPDSVLLHDRVRDLRLADGSEVAAGLGNVKAANSVLLGILSAVLDVPDPTWEKAIRGGVPPRTVEVNLEAFRVGREMTFPDEYPSVPVVIPAAPRVPPRIEITQAWCKGCDICVRFCPEGVLALDAHEKVVAIDPEACTGCRLCDLLCPDFAIAIRPAEAVTGGVHG